MARFFISHSATTDGEAQRVLYALIDRLQKRGHDVFTDSAIAPGAPWRAVLNHELAQCDAALVLLNADALRSKWVKREVWMLLWRHYLGSSVRIRAVLLDGVAPSDVRGEGFGELAELQFILPRQHHLSVVEIARAAVDDFGEVSRCEDPMHAWISRVVDLLKQVERGETLKKFARALGVADDELDQLILEEGYRFLAHQLLVRASPESAYYAVDSVKHIVNVQSLAGFVAPALVEGEAARILLTSSPGSFYAVGGQGRTVYALNAEIPDTAALYVRRATCCEAGFKHQHVAAVVGEELVRELVAECRKAVWRMLNVGDQWPEAQRQQWLRKYPSGHFPMFKGGFLIIDPAGASMPKISEAVDIVLDEFDFLKVIILTGYAVPDEGSLHSLGLDDVVLLRPPLAEDEELEVSRTVDALKNLAKGWVIVS